LFEPLQGVIYVGKNKMRVLFLTGRLCNNVMGLLW